MSHQIEQMFSANGITPWHTLGTIFESAPTLVDAWIASGQDFQIEKFALHTPEGDPVPNCYGTRRTDTGAILTGCRVVSEDWQPLQNVEVWRALQPYMDSGLITPETGGTLAGGRRVWVLCSFAGSEISIGRDGDTVRSYLLLANGHDGSLSIRVGMTAVRVVCQNTLSMALDAEIASYRHVGDVAGKLHDGVDAIMAAQANVEATARVYRHLAELPIRSGQQIADFVARVYGADEKATQEQGKISRRLAAVAERFEAGQGQDLDGAKHTAWGLYNALTEYVSHQGRDLDKKMDGLAFGSRAGVLQRGLEAAVVVGRGIPLDQVFDLHDVALDRADDARWANA